MTTRDRFNAVMNFESFDRLPIFEWAGWWDKTVERWHGEGLPAELEGAEEISRHFDLDIHRQMWIHNIGDVPRPTHHGAGIIQRPEDYDKIHDGLWPKFDGWPVDTAKLDSWVDEHEKGELTLWFTLNGFFWTPRSLFGIENHLFAFYDHPELMHRMNRENAEHMIWAIDKVCEHCSPDFMTFAEDMSYNNGPMLSKELFDEFMRPYYDMVVPHLKEKGIIPIIDSDGDVTMAADWFAEAGLAGILPLERQAGVDLSVIREKHPKMCFIGHYDKMVMNKGEDAMRAEFERLLPLAKQGGFIISCDHQTPPGVSYDDYKLYLKLFREYAEKAAE